MESLIYVNISGLQKELYEIYEQIKEYCYPPKKDECVYKGQGSGITIYLEQNSPYLNEICSICEERDLDPFIAEHTFYTKKEENSCEYFQMRIYSPLESEGSIASDYGTQCVGGCPHCGLGKETKGDVFVNRRFMKKRGIFSLRPDIVASPDVKWLIESEEFTGITFDTCLKDYKNREIDEYHCAKIPNVLPEMDKSTWLIVKYEDPRYKKCGHHVRYLLSDIKYNRHSLEHATDFNLSCEYVNNFRERCVVVSKRVRDVFLKNKVKVKFNPVQIIE